MQACTACLHSGYSVVQDCLCLFACTRLRPLTAAAQDSLPHGLHCLHRAVPEPEAIGVLCGTVRIQSAGLLKMKQAQGKSKKKG